jgi:pyruvate dehydrogenase E1 component alpha subunit
MGTAVERASAVPEIRQKAEGYGMKSAQVDGMDVMKVREIALRMIEEVRQGEGPQLLEVTTYRFRGHSMGDPERYRSAAEVKLFQENDPIGIYHHYLLDNQIASEDELKNLIDLAERDVEEAVAFAESSPEPAPEDLFKYIYVEE